MFEDIINGPPRPCKPLSSAPNEKLQRALRLPFSHDGGRRPSRATFYVLSGVASVSLRSCLGSSALRQRLT
ncbi:MAG: hypothetical protein BGO98_39170 [Myxococcales bacterium 68-20]|nr:MAG: hypothetical protein BGO98_39170 [Myxococcales bacterium 68-20]